jgi:hypothetical protein
LSFLLSSLALLLGPFIYGWGRTKPVAKQILDGIVLVAVAAIVCVNIIPGALDIGGWLALVALVAGLLFPLLFERLFDRSVHSAHAFIVFLAAMGLILHAVVDGVALLPSLGDAESASAGRTFGFDLRSILDNPLAQGVILHRLPVGMAIWWTVRPNFGAPIALLTFALIIAATGLTYYFGAPVVEMAEGHSLALFKAFVAGSLVHVVAFGISHHHGQARDDVFVPANNWAFRVGILLGMFIVFAIPHLH